MSCRDWVLDLLLVAGDETVVKRRCAVPCCCAVEQEHPVPSLANH